MIHALRRRLKKPSNPFEGFAKQADLVYFGEVHEQHGIDPVKGITFTRHRRDRHFMQGPRRQHEIVVLDRTIRVETTRQSSGQYQWTIVRVGLHHRGLPHLFLDGYRYDERLYQNVFAKFANLRLANFVVAQVDPQFVQQFQVFCQAADADHVRLLLSTQLMQALSSYYRQFDIEIDQHYLYLYYNSTPQTVQQLQQLVDGALWLAQAFEQQAQAIEALNS